jgi:hypothetical protein
MPLHAAPVRGYSGQQAALPTAAIPGEAPEMLKTFYLKHVKAEDARRRIENLGLVSYTIQIDVDERLNALTVNTPHEDILQQIEGFISSIDAEAPPR